MQSMEKIVLLKPSHVHLQHLIKETNEMQKLVLWICEVCKDKGLKLDKKLI